ncbi:MAG: hypothetical protein KAJ19_09970 [Gammaproteobacteria bacterium]|nr:hypothetical protein [Gammaproteobacteria bacterium]
MASRSAGYYNVFDPVSGRYVRRPKRRRRAKRVSGLGGLASFGQASGLKPTISSVKGVLITGSIAAGGAIITARLFDKVAGRWNIEGWKRDLAQIATGIALGILIAKLLKKPKLAVAFAIGPVVAGAIKIFSELMGPGATQGLGLTAFTPSNAYESMYSPLYGAGQPNALGLTTYEAMGSKAYPASVPKAPAKPWSLPATV